MDYFALLELPQQFALDAQQLESAYFKAQRRFHPDRFAAKPAAERVQAMQRSADINQAYHHLKNPLLRAQYLLHLHGITVGSEQGSIKPSPSLLMDTLEWREAVAQATDSATLAALEEQQQRLHAETLHDIAATYDASNWPAMADHTLKLGYIVKTQEETALRKLQLKTSSL